MNEKIFDNEVFENFKFQESDGSSGDLGTLPNGVISVVKGPSFVPNGYSRNKRFYSKKLWENVLGNHRFKQNLKNKRMYGCIGHPIGEFSEDELLASGKVSHIVTDAFIDGDKGYCTYEILDTPAGRILNTVLKAGSKLFTSSRGFGEFKGNEVKEHGGSKYRILNENNFFVQTWDFVIDPGFLEAQPNLVESIQEDLSELKKDKLNIKCSEGLCSIYENMDKSSSLSTDDLLEIIESLKDENAKLLSLTNVSENITPNSSTEKETSKKVELEITYEQLFLTYIENLMTLIKFKKDYESIYLELLNIIDNKDIIIKDKIPDIIGKIRKLKPIDDSINTLLNNIDKLLEKEKQSAENPEESGEVSKVDSKDIKEFLLTIKETMRYINNIKLENNNSNDDSILINVIEHLTSKNLEINNELKESLDIIATTTSKAETIFENTTSLENKLKESKIKIDTSKDIIEKLENKVSEYESLVEELNTDVTSKLKESKEKIQELESTNQQLESENKKISSTYENDLSYQEIKIRDLSKKLEDLQEDFNGEKESSTELETQYTTKIQELEKTFESKLDAAGEIIFNLMESKYQSLYPNLDIDIIKLTLEANQYDYTKDSNIKSSLDRHNKKTSAKRYLSNNENLTQSIGTNITEVKKEKREILARKLMN
jgi:hypothetical protein